MSPELTVEQAIARLRRYAPFKENIYYVCVADRGRRLIGFADLKDFILS